MNTSEILKLLLTLMLELNNDAKEATQKAIDTINADYSVLDNDINFQKGRAAAFMSASSKVGRIVTDIMQDVKSLKN